MSATQPFTPVSRWHPEGLAFWAVRPKRTLGALSHAPVAIRIDERLPGPTVTSWSFDRRDAEDRIRVAFASAAILRSYAIRWRILADVMHAIGRADRSFAFTDVRIDLGDGAVATAHPDVLAFARPRGSQVRLIPNPYLLRPRPWLPRPLPWERKSDTLYFRGTSTGARDYEANVRVALCRTARTIPRSDCRLSRVKQVDATFARRLAEDGLTGWRHPRHFLNRHRFLVEADGNTSSWDRYLLIGSLGGVPIRFEAAWEECWHDLLVDGENCVVADRHTLPEIVARMRADSSAARAIAAAAQRTVQAHLSRRALLGRLADTLCG